MYILDRHRAGIARFAWGAAWFGLLLGLLHALARYRTEDGKADLELPLTAAWAEPAGRALRPLLDWGDPDLVYVTYGKLWLPVFVALLLAALVVHRQRRPQGFERWAWLVALTGYAVAVVSVGAEYWTQWSGSPNGLLDVIFAASIPAMLLTLLASTVLGVTLLRRGFRPRVAAWLLALTFPLALVIPQVTSLGNVILPVAFVYALGARRLAASPDDVPALAPTTA